MRNDIASDGSNPVAGAAPGSMSTTLRWLTVVVLMMLVIVGYFDRISIAVLFNDTDFQTAMGTGFNPALLGGLMTVFFLTYGISSLFMSFTGDRFGPRNMLIAGSLIWGVLMVAMGRASSYASMFVSRILLGLFEGPQFSWILKVVSTSFPSRELGRANAIWLLGSPLGSAIGFPLIIGLVAAFGWRQAFYLLAALSIVLMAPLIFVVLRPNAGTAAPRETRAPMTVASIWRDSRLFLRSRDFWLLTIFDCGELIYLWGLNSWLPTYLQRVRHFDLQHLGLYSSLPFVMLFFGEILSGILSDRMARKAYLLLIGLAGAAVLLYIATLVDAATTAALLIALSSGFFGLCVPATYVLTTRIVPPSVIASGTGVINGIANTVGALAPFAMGLVISATGSFDAGLYVLVCGALLCSLAIIPLLRKL